MRPDPSYLKKIVSWEGLAQRLEQLRGAGRRIVFTNGCFDLIHPGHVRYLDQARSLGDILVVGLNSDQSVRSLGKGGDRPVQTQEHRAEVLAALESVGFVAVFDQDTPYELIAKAQPDILVKGGDWPVEEIVGADLVLARGGEVLSLAYWEGESSTDIINRVRGRTPQ